MTDLYEKYKKERQKCRNQKRYLKICKNKFKVPTEIKKYNTKSQMVTKTMPPPSNNGAVKRKLRRKYIYQNQNIENNNESNTILETQKSLPNIECTTKEIKSHQEEGTSSDIEVNKPSDSINADINENPTEHIFPPVQTLPELNEMCSNLQDACKAKLPMASTETLALISEQETTTFDENQIKDKGWEALSIILKFIGINDLDCLYENIQMYEFLESKNLASIPKLEQFFAECNANRDSNITEEVAKSDQEIIFIGEADQLKPQTISKKAIEQLLQLSEMNKNMIHAFSDSFGKEVITEHDREKEAESLKEMQSHNKQSKTNEEPSVNSPVITESAHVPTDPERSNRCVKQSDLPQMHQMVPVSHAQHSIQDPRRTITLQESYNRPNNPQVSPHRQYQQRNMQTPRCFQPYPAVSNQNYPISNEMNNYIRQDMSQYKPGFAQSHRNHNVYAQGRRNTHYGAHSQYQSTTTSHFSAQQWPAITEAPTIGQYQLATTTISSSRHWSVTTTNTYGQHWPVTTMSRTCIQRWPQASLNNTTMQNWPQTHIASTSRQFWATTTVANMSNPHWTSGQLAAMANATGYPINRG